MTHANGAQVGRALPALLQTARCSGGVGVEPACCLEVEMFVCACARARVFVWSGTHSVGKRAHSSRTRLSPSADKLSRRRLQPAAPTAVRSLSPRFFFVPGRPAADNLPPPPHPPLAAYPGRDATSRPEQPTGVSRRGSEGAQAPQMLQLTAFSLLRHAGASTTQVDGAEFGEDGKKGATKHQTSASRGWQQF